MCKVCGLVRSYRSSMAPHDYQGGGTFGHNGGAHFMAAVGAQEGPGDPFCQTPPGGYPGHIYHTTAARGRHDR